MKRPAVTIGLLAAVLLLAGCILHSRLTTTTIPKVEKEIDSALPVGSTRQEIEAWLTGENIEFGFTDKLSSYTALVERVPDVRNYSGAVVAIIRDTDRDLLVSGNIQMFFLLDPDGHLSKRVVYWVGTGL